MARIVFAAPALLSALLFSAGHSRAGTYDGSVSIGNRTVSGAATQGQAKAGNCKSCSAEVKSNAFHSAAGTSFGTIGVMTTKTAIDGGVSGGTTDKGGGGGGAGDKSTSSGKGPGLIAGSTTRSSGIGSTQVKATGPGASATGNYAAGGGAYAHANGALEAAEKGQWTGPALGTLGSFKAGTAK